MAVSFDIQTKKGQFLSKLRWLDTEYYPWKAIYKDVRMYLFPFSGWFPEDDAKNFDPLGNDERYNASVTRACRIFGAGMMYGNCRPSTPWFQFDLDDADLAAYKPVRDWLDSVEDVFYRVFAKSNFYESQQRGFEDQGGFGTTVMLPEPRPVFPFVHFHKFPVGSYRLGQGNYERIDSIYRPIRMQARNMAAAFGKDNLSDAVQQALDKSPYDWFDVVHVIEPRQDTEREYGKIDNTNMAWKSCWFEQGGEDGDKLLRESGYPAFPCVVPRFIKVDGSPYGIGPGIDVLKRIKMLQQMELSGLKGLHREIEPPLVAPNRFDGVLNLTPNAVNFDSGDAQKGAVYPILQTSINWQWFQSRLDVIEQSVDRAFMVDLFLMIMQSAETDPQRTATEVMKRWEEKMTVLGPVTEHQQTNNFDPCIEQTWSILAGVPGLLPPPPPEIQGRELKIRYVSVLAQAQKMAEIDKMNTYLNVVDRVAAYDPTIVHATDFYKMLKETDEAIGLPSSVMRDEGEYMRRVEAQRKAEMMAQQMAAAESVTGSAKNLGQASTEEGTALGDMTK